VIPILQVAAREDLYGASRAALAIARHLAEHDFVAELVSPEEGPLQEAWRTIERPTFIAPVGGGRSVWSRLTRRIALEPAIEWARAQRIKAAAALTLSAAPAAEAIARALDVPLIVHLRNIYASRGRASPFEKYGAPRASLVIAASQFILDEYGSARPATQKAEVITDGIDPPLFLSRAEARKKLGLDPNGRYLATAGAISPQKGTLFAAEVAARLGDVELIVLGDGRGDYADRVRASARARAMGFRDDAPELLAAFDLFLHPSAAEALGLAPVEAMAAGVPVIATHVGGLPESVADGGVLLSPGDHAAWAAACRRILDDTEYTKALVARGRAQSEKMSAAIAARRTAQAYRALIGSP
jgi:glycosyltransferase involved in cell wall biosynthesis